VRTEWRCLAVSSSPTSLSTNPKFCTNRARIKKDLELIVAKNPILRPITQKIECGEADELMNKVLKMFEEIEETEKFRLQLQV
jgi:hypothetical protein